MSHVDSTSPITHISLCAGYGGIDLGLQRAVGGIRTILFSEIEAFACANLVSKMEAGLLDAAPIWTDLKTLPWDEFCGKVDILSGGFPCQPFSAAGKRQGDEDPRHLFPFILDGIRRCRPSIVFLENVEGILSAKLAGDNWRDPAGTPVLLHVFRELERVGYKCTAGVFSASEVGAPHQRKRVFIMAHFINEGSQGWLRGGAHEKWENLNGYLGCSGSSAFRGWPSRPGEPQHEWEPPRVVGNAKGVRPRAFGAEHEGFSGELCSAGAGSQGVVGNTSDKRKLNEAEQDFTEAGSLLDRTSEGAGMGNAAEQGLSISGGQCGEMEQPGAQSESERPDGSMGNAASIRPCGGCEDGLGEQPEMPRQGSQCTTKQRQTQPSLGGNPDGSSRGVDYAELQEPNHADCGAGAEHGEKLAHGFNNGCSSSSSDRGVCGKKQDERREKEQESVKQFEGGSSFPFLYSNLCVSCDNRTDELRLLGNGVVPATAELAFRTLWEELTA